MKSATVGGEGSWDYIYADVAARRLYIPRHPSSADLAKPGIVLVLCAVFIPVAFLGGIAGVLYKQFAVTVGASAGKRLC